MLLWCPGCGERHIEVEFANRIHHTHACQSCGMVWRPAVVPTYGVQFLPGLKEGEDADALRASAFAKMCGEAERERVAESLEAAAQPEAAAHVRAMPETPTGEPESRETMTIKTMTTCERT